MNKEKRSAASSKTGLFILIIVFTVIFSLSIDFRFFNLNNIPNSEKFIVLISTGLFIAVLIDHYLLPIIQAFNQNPKRLIILITAIGLTAVIFLLVPYQVVPFRTQHSLMIRVPETSAPVIINQVQNSDNDPVVLAEFQTIEESQNVLLMPGKNLDYQREMTGGMTVFVSADRIPAVVEVTWDGTTSSHTISSVNSQKQISLSGSSLGRPDNSHLLLLLINIISDIFSCFLIILVIIQILISSKLKVISWSEPGSFLKVKEKFIIIQLILLLLSRGSMTIPIFSTYVPNAILIMGWIFWGYALLAGKLTQESGYQLKIVFFISLAVLSIIMNIFFFPKQPSFSPIRLSRLGTSFSDLVNSTWTTFTNVVSVDFYEQLDHSNLILSENVQTNTQFEPQRFLDINHAKSVQIEDYPSMLSEDQFNTLLSDNRLLSSAYNNLAMNQLGTIYLLETPDNIDRTYILYQYKVDIFLLPPGTIKESIQ